MNKRIKIGLVGGLIGFLLPWIIFIIPVITCTGFNCGEFGFALQPIIILSVFTLLSGILIGYIISSKKFIRIFGLLGFILSLVYFLYKYLNYVNLPSIEQRGISSLFFTSLLLSLALSFLGALIGRFFKR